LTGSTTSHLARTVLPLPQTVAGAVRAKLFRKMEQVDDPGVKRKLEGLIWADSKGSEEPGFELRGLFFSEFENNESLKTLYLPAPFDIIRDKDGTIFSVKPHPVGWKGFKATVFSGRSLHFEPAGGYLSFEVFKQYLSGNLPDAELMDSLVPESRLYVRESRIGIGLTPSKVVQEHLFYRTEMLRLREGMGLTAWMWGPDDILYYLGRSGTLKLGGEGRFVRYFTGGEEIFKEFAEYWEKEILPEIKRRHRFKLYLATPAILEDDSYYTWGPPLDGEDISVVPLIGKPVPISGWDMRSGSPKATRYAVPPGSVYFVEFEGEPPVNSPWTKVGRPKCRKKSGHKVDLTRLGYGLAFVGVW